MTDEQKQKMAEEYADFDCHEYGDEREIAIDCYLAGLNRGLAANWFGHVWLNPPYGTEIKAWLEKLADHGNGVALIFARTDTKWFQAISKRASSVKFVAGRIKFLRPDFTTDTNAGAPSCLIAFGDQDLSSIRGVELVRKA